MPSVRTDMRALADAPVRQEAFPAVCNTYIGIHAAGRLAFSFDLFSNQTAAPCNAFPMAPSEGTSSAFGCEKGLNLERDKGAYL